jgi:hypothetical protein
MEAGAYEWSPSRSGRCIPRIQQIRNCEDHWVRTDTEPKRKSLARNPRPDIHGISTQFSESAISETGTKMVLIRQGLVPYHLEGVSNAKNFPSLTVMIQPFSILYADLPQQSAVTLTHTRQQHGVGCHKWHMAVIWCSDDTCSFPGCHPVHSVHRVVQTLHRCAVTS